MTNYSAMRLEDTVLNDGGCGLYEYVNDNFKVPVMKVRWVSCGERSYEN